ncbi:biotin--[acetyl-CoA-carboxylase] ligase [Desulforamulus hydrothermalis]|uniref:Bifunctional ligase/repressor BirA n=1 Tax=Desulforamulus hydrothermalis Lam5 = DSM 18033 TaxID=1121428 RepID=K8EAL9_9FIRM|nr:biotin--[acetyl-CoA-carboxylase] ligase [Desulforamulus hydrothermalis]CCO08683.1 Biotin--acetyl-CoA-carboxylase ligase [Desulforamulus hydrothermalis Lam5 = DSM 18033]SHH38610.1 BirA family transcriptional regulator, biotin operon repressor / biotin-[acetyl-CoA-carboxylase] ligase [Desulforamulus hydrothermalis Lam5 = DSM 18033]
MSAKQKILDLLKTEPAYVSGEYICQQLQVSRTAVWKIIESLRRDGYAIEARPRAGYRLLAVPDVLDPAGWLSGLTTRLIGRKTHYVKTTASTNDLAKELARQGAAEGMAVITEEQTRGRGRLGRSWQCPPRAGLCFSVILYPQVNPTEVSRFTLLAAVAVVRACERTLGIRAGIKWPNDVYAGGAKFCGILAEMAAEADRVKYLVLGIGVNVNQTESELAPLGSTATSLRLQCGRPVSRTKVLKAILEELDSLYALWHTEGFASLKEQWSKVTLWYGASVVVSDLHRVWEGIMEGIDNNGALILRLPDNTCKTFYSGEVSLRPSPQAE